MRQSPWIFSALLLASALHLGAQAAAAPPALTQLSADNAAMIRSYLRALQHVQNRARAEDLQSFDRHYDRQTMTTYLGLLAGVYQDAAADLKKAGHAHNRQAAATTATWLLHLQDQLQKAANDKQAQALVRAIPLGQLERALPAQAAAAAGAATTTAAKK